MEILFNISSKESNSVRINETFRDKELATSLFEKNDNTLRKLIQKGRNSFAENEKSIIKIFEL